MSELITGFLWCNIKTSDDVQRALNSHPDTKEIRAAVGLKEPLSGLEGVKVFFEREVPAGHIFLIPGD